MTSRTLARRLERLEEELMPEDDPKIWEIVIVDPDGTRTPTGIRIEMPPPGRTRGGDRAFVKR